jgi:hypothetical protein
MDKRLVSKQDQLAAFQTVPNTSTKHNPTGVLQYLALSSFETRLSSSDYSQFWLIFLLVQNIASSRSIGIERD